MEILLIEDKASDANLIKTLCKTQFRDANITITSTLEDGKTYLEKHDFNLIILDLGLPDSDGLGTLYKIRSVTKCPVVVLSGYNDESLALEAIRHGAEDYLIKGVNAERLCRSLKFAIQRHARKMPSTKSTKHFDKNLTKLSNIVKSLTQSIVE